MDFSTLAATYGTPLYVYDFDHMKSRYEELKEAFSGRKSLICYAVKANSNLSVIKLFADLGAGADCVSIGEVRRALMAGVPKYKIIYSGVGKRDDEIEEALREDILFLNLESEAEMLRVEMIAKEMGSKARISIRVNPDIDPKTHPYISTGLTENKFGVDIEVAKKMYAYSNKSEYLEPVGVHFHIGSQLTDLEPIYEAAQKVSELLKALLALKINIKFFDVGGGLGVVYDNEETIPPYNYAQVILSTLTGTDVTIVCEPGKFMTANGGYFLTKVLYEKYSKEKRFVIVDGAMNDLIRPALYGAFHGVEVVGKDTMKSKADIVGPVCESGDFFAKDEEIAETAHGDLVVIKSAGSYGFSMSSNYNSRPRTAEVAVEDGKHRIIRKRESFEDLIALEKDFLK